MMAPRLMKNLVVLASHLTIFSSNPEPEPHCWICERNVGVGCMATQLHPYDSGPDQPHCDGFIWNGQSIEESTCAAQ